MKTATTKADTPIYKSILWVLLGTAGVLVIPLVAMQFSSEVNWGVEDFTVIGTLLISAGLLYIFLTRQVHDAHRRFVTGLIIAGVVLYLWAELAVGIFTNWGS